MDISKCVATKAIITKNKDLIPFWDNRLSLENNKLFGDSIVFEGINHYNFVDCVYDIETKEIKATVELNHYEINEQFEKGMQVLYQYKSYRKTLSLNEIKDIVYEKFDLTIRKGSELDNNEKSLFKDVVFENDVIYSIKSWKPYYLLDNGEKVSEYSLFILKN